MEDRLLLLAWEKGFHQSLIYKGLYLLQLLYPHANLEELMAFSIGRRDVNLLYLRSLLFGNQLENTAHCPECGQKTEWTMPLKQLYLQPLETQEDKEEFTLEQEGKPIAFRLPNNQDLLELSTENPSAWTTERLLQKCILQQEGIIRQVEDFSDIFKQQIIEKIAELDPQADINIGLSCPECEYQWSLNFNILTYLWTELEDYVYRLLQDIGRLAMNFGWSENSILEMSRFRRNLYLQMLGT